VRRYKRLQDDDAKHEDKINQLRASEHGLTTKLAQETHKADAAANEASQTKVELSQTHARTIAAEAKAKQPAAENDWWRSETTQIETRYKQMCTTNQALKTTNKELQAEVTAEKTRNMELSTKNEQLATEVVAEKFKNKENAETMRGAADQAEIHLTAVKEENLRLKSLQESLEKEIKNGLYALNDLKKRIRALGNEF